MLYETDRMKVRSLLPEDQHLLVKWLSDPKVLQYYEGRDNPFNLQKVERSFYYQEKGIVKCLVEFEGKKIGYIQFYKVNSVTSEITDYSEEENVYGIDQFIGETDYWNKGIGTMLISSMVDYLMEQKQAGRIIMDPHVSNTRALRCYEKCGFKKVRILPKHEWHEGEYRDCWLIEYTKSSI